jgi:hypothetical protein
MPLGCTGDKCSTITKHLDSIRKIVAGKKRGTILACNYIEEGTCGIWRYIYCDQGQPGTQLRFFDENGYVAASYFISDYGEFCDGLARVQYMGQIPSCQPLVTKQVMYGKGKTPIAPASRSWPSAAAQGQPQTR